MNELPISDPAMTQFAASIVLGAISDYRTPSPQFPTLSGDTRKWFLGMGEHDSAECLTCEQLLDCAGIGISGEELVRVLDNQGN